MQSLVFSFHKINAFYVCLICWMDGSGVIRCSARLPQGMSLQMNQCCITGQAKATLTLLTRTSCQSSWTRFQTQQDRLLKISVERPTSPASMTTSPRAAPPSPTPAKPPLTALWRQKIAQVCFTVDLTFGVSSALPHW